MAAKIQTGLRLPEDLYHRILTMAERMGISINALLLILIDKGLKAFDQQE